MPDSLLLPLLALRRWLSPHRHAAVQSEKPSVRSMRPEDRAEVLDGWLAHGASGHILEREGRCVGFFLVLLAGDHLHLANLAVAPDERRKGIATLALQKIENIAWAYGLPRVELEVRETNLAAQLLYRRNGYRAVDILRSYYPDQDAYRMTKDVLHLPGPRGARGRTTDAPLNR